MGRRYGGRAVRGQGGTRDGRAVRTVVARSLNFAFRAVRLAYRPRGTTTTTRTTRTTRIFLAIWVPEAVPPPPPHSD